MVKDEDFKKIAAENDKRIKSITRYYTRSGDDFNDLYQEILINIWKSLGNFKGDSSINTYVYRVALNTAITFANKEAKRLSYKIEWDIEQFESVLSSENEGSHITPEMEEELKNELNNLTIIDRSIIILLLENVSSKEISQIIGITEPNVRVKIHRIKEDLRNKLNKGKHEKY
jgi:RNA polymerase sigma-70 factor, ECF subfamily